jgi:hypothetical protein
VGCRKERPAVEGMIMTVSIGDVLICRATAAAMPVAGSETPEHAPSRPERTKQSPNIIIVGAGSATAALSAGLSAKVRRHRLIGRICFQLLYASRCRSLSVQRGQRSPDDDGDALVYERWLLPPRRRRAHAYPSCDERPESDLKRSMRRLAMTTAA